MGRPKRLYPLGKYRLRTPKESDKNKAYPIELEYTWNRQIIRKTTNVFVKETDWNQNGNQGRGEPRVSYGPEYKRLNQLLLALYEEVGRKYGLERGDSIEGRNIQHLNKRDYIRKLTKEQKKMEKAIRGLQTMRDNIEAEMKMFSNELKILEKDLAAGRVVLAEYQSKKACIEDLIHDCQERLDD